MLDVHPPHEAAHTWKDFFIHIATIVVGLLIAVGLEQTVEFFHHRHEVRDAREALKLEREENAKILTANVACFRWTRQMLRNNLNVLLYLEKHPGTPEEKLPGILMWRAIYEPVSDSAWKNVQQTQVLSMFPRQEAEDLAQFYLLVDNMQTSAILAANDIVSAGDYAATDPNPSHLTPAQLDKQIDVAMQALGANFNWGIWLMVTSRADPHFHGGITFAELEKENGTTRSAEDKQRLAKARAQTDQFLAATGAALEAAEKELGLH